MEKVAQLQATVRGVLMGSPSGSPRSDEGGAAPVPLTAAGMARASVEGSMQMARAGMQGGSGRGLGAGAGAGIGSGAWLGLGGPSAMVDPRLGNFTALTGLAVGAGRGGGGRRRAKGGSGSRGGGWRGEEAEAEPKKFVF